MHSDDRTRYHLRPLVDVLPGDRISLDAQAIAAMRDDRPGDVDWADVDDHALDVLDRTRLSATRLTLRTRGGLGNVEGATGARLLLQPRADRFIT